MTAPSPDLAVEGYAYVYEQVADSLSRLQDANSVRPANQTAMQTIVQPTVPYLTPASVVRPAAGLVLLGLGLAIALASLADAFAKRRSVRSGVAVTQRAEGMAAGSDDETVPTEDAPVARTASVLHSLQGSCSDTSLLVGAHGRRS